MGVGSGERFLGNPRLGHGLRPEEQVRIWGGKEVSMFGKENRIITILHLPKYLGIYPLVYLTVQIDSQQNIVRQYENITGKGINVR